MFDQTVKSGQNESQNESQNEYLEFLDRLDSFGEPDVPGLAEALGQTDPGPELHALLAGLDLSGLTGYELVAALKAYSRMVGHFQAGVMTAISEIAFRADPEFGHSSRPVEFVAAEVASALKLTRRSAEAQVDLALSLHGRYRDVRDLLRDGRIDSWRARILTETTSHLPADKALEVIRRVLADAPDLTGGQLRARLTRICMEAFPENARAAVEGALAQRRVVVEATGEGTANLLGLDLPADSVMAIRKRINLLARELGKDERTHDQKRADILLDLLLGTAIGQGRAQVDIVVDLSTLAGIDEKPGHIPGWGPVTAEMSRRIVSEQPDATWVGTVKKNGNPITSGILRRRPTVAQERSVLGMHATCVFPGCRMPSSDSDLDHTVAHSDGGPTVTENLAPLCRYHHRVKHEGGWSYRRECPGLHTWTSPLGHRYTVDSRDPP